MGLTPPTYNQLWIIHMKAGLYIIEFSHNATRCITGKKIKDGRGGESKATQLYTPLHEGHVFGVISLKSHIDELV